MDYKYECIVCGEKGTALSDTYIPERDRMFCNKCRDRKFYEGMLDTLLDGAIDGAKYKQALSRISTLSGLTLEDLARQDDFRYDSYIERLQKIHKLAKGAEK